MLRLWNRLLTFDSNRLTRKNFEFDYDNCNLVCNWCSEIRQVY